MRRRLLPVLASLSIATAAAVAVPTVAVADPVCTPVIAPASLAAGPAKIVMKATGEATFRASAAFTAPCGTPDHSDLEALIAIGPIDEAEPKLVLDFSGIIDHEEDTSFSFDGFDKLLRTELDNADAGTWASAFQVTDTNDPEPESNTTTVNGPTFQVLRAAKVTANASPEPVKKGRTITVSGRLTRANWDKGTYSAYRGKSVLLQFRTTTGTYATVKTVTSDSDGDVRAKVTAAKDGLFRFKFTGSSTTASTYSVGDFVDVKS